MNVNPIVLAIPVYFILIAIEVVYDNVKGKRLYRLGDALSNISCGIFEQTTGLFIKVITIGIYHYCYTYFRLANIEESIFTGILLFIGVDFLYYWAHRLDHEVNLLWLGHVVHHQSEDYNLSVAIRQGALQKLFNIAFMLPLAIIGFETTWFLFIGAFTTLYQFWIHTETINKLPAWFEYVFNTPSHHRVHHGRNPQYIDKNHGGTFIIWDRLFGTFEPEVEPPIYGITTPTRTFNPVVAHIQPLTLLAKQVKSTPGFTNKLKVVFNPPGWQPDELGGRIAVPEINKDTFIKFETTIPLRWSAYLLVQYLIVLGLAAWLLFSYKQLGTPVLLIGAALVIGSIFSIGYVFDNPTFGLKSELLRLLIFTLTMFTIASGVYMTLGIGICLISIGWVAFLAFQSHQHPSLNL